MIRVGSAKAEITPPIGLPLSGFAMRQNRPSTAIDDALYVKALALESCGELVLLLSYDLLGFDFPLDEQIRDRLSAAFGDQLSAARTLITTTHTHSGPPTMPIAGETRVPEDYILTLCRATEAAVSQALGNLAEAELFHAATHLTGINLNRRQARFPDQPPDRFPLDDSLDLFVFRTPQGACQASMVRLSCHAVTMTTQHVSADFPGELTRRIEAQSGAPCLFFPGTAGDINPVTVSQGHAAMLAFVNMLQSQIADLPSRLQPVPVQILRVAQRSFTLPFAPFPPKGQVLETMARIDRIMAGDLISPDLLPLVEEYAAWSSPDDNDRQRTVLHWAQVFQQSSLVTLEASEAPQDHLGAPFRISLLQLGPFRFIFLTGEVFTTLGKQIQALAPDQAIRVVSYLSPIVGYLPTSSDCAIGGYEIGNAWKWYRMPGPFREDIAGLIVEQVQALLTSIPEEQSNG